MTLLLVYLAVALLVSFLCSLLEAVLLSVPRTHIAVLKQQGSQAAARLEQMKEDIDKPLAAILTLNTFAHTLGAAGVGAQAAVIWGEAWVGLVSFVLTLLVLIFSEIIPKTIGAVHAKRLAPFASTTTMVLIVIFKPVVAVCNWVSKLFAPRGPSLPSISREEVSNLAELAHAEGVIDAVESRIVRNIVALREITAEQVMTPRAVVFTYNASDTPNKLLEAEPAKFARAPVVEGSLDNYKGVLHRRELYTARHTDQGDTPLSELARPLHAVPESAPLSSVLEQFLQRQEHLFLVVDEYGGASGIITLEDTIETLLGAEIIDETDDEADMQALAKRMVESLDAHHPSRSATHRADSEPG